MSQNNFKYAHLFGDPSGRSAYFFSASAFRGLSKYNLCQLDDGSIHAYTEGCLLGTNEPSMNVDDWVFLGNGKWYGHREKREVLNPQATARGVEYLDRSESEEFLQSDLMRIFREASIESAAKAQSPDAILECAVCHSPQHRIINLKNQNTRVLCAEVADGDPPLPAGYICHCCTCADEAFEPPRNKMEKSLKQRLPKDYYRFPQITFCLADQAQRDVVGKMFRRKLGAHCNMIAIHAEDSEFKMTILARGAFLLDETLALKTELENAGIIVRRIERRFPDSVTFDYTAD